MHHCTCWKKNCCSLHLIIVVVQGLANSQVRSYSGCWAGCTRWPSEQTYRSNVYLTAQALLLHRWMRARITSVYLQSEDWCRFQQHSCSAQSRFSVAQLAHSACGPLHSTWTRCATPPSRGHQTPDSRNLFWACFCVMGLHRHLGAIKIMNWIKTILYDITLLIHKIMYCDMQ